MTEATIERDKLTHYLNDMLDVSIFRDYGPNGLQVEGKPVLRKLITGVTASQALIDAAIEAHADAVLVHHGLFWRGQNGCITGWMRKRLASLLKHDINLLAYHLPLDAHKQYGNNAQWGKKLGLVADSFFGDQAIGSIGAAPSGFNLGMLVQLVEATMLRKPIVIAGDGRPLRRIAWCSGGAQSTFEAAIEQGADAYLTGEISEPQAHYARESGVAYLACGHHASERYGVQALGSAVANQFGIAHQFIDIDNPA